MRLALIQTEKTSFQARFELVRNGEAIGSLGFQGLMVGDEGRWSGNLHSTRLALEYERGDLGTLLPDADNLYNAYINGSFCGTVRRDGGRTAAGFSIKSITADLHGARYECWPFSLGRAGYRYPVFKDGVQVAEISKGCKVRDDLHSFDIAIANDGDACATVLICAYIFCQSWWKPGPAVRRHTHYYIQRKTRCGAPWPYGEGFMKLVGQ